MPHIKIPDNVQPYWSATINNKTYRYPAGTEQEVPDEVAALIGNLEEMEDGSVSYSEQASDWNQNDPTATDYIKNRTHWVETEMISEEVQAMEQTKLRDFPVFGVGDTVAISVDGVEYSLSAYADSGMGGNVGIGDTAAEINAGGGEYGWKLWVSSGTARIASINPCTVSYAVETVHTIDHKYLPDIVLTSPNGTKFTLMVDNDGSLHASYTPNSGGPV